MISNYELTTVEPKNNLSFGNLSFKNQTLESNLAANLLEINANSLNAKTNYFHEDIYDSDDEFRIKASMSKDKRFWKVDSEDLMLRFGRRSFNNQRKQGKKTCQVLLFFVPYYFLI